MLFTCRSIFQFTVECHAEILGGGRRFDALFTDCHGLCVDLCIQGTNWVLSEFTQLQPIWLHPFLDSFDPQCQSKSKAIDIKLAIVGIGVTSDTKWCGNGDDIWGVQEEKEWAQHWTLWHAVFQLDPCWSMTIESDWLLSTLDKWWNPCKRVHCGRIYLISHVHRAYDYFGLFGLFGVLWVYVWLDTTYSVKKNIKILSRWSLMPPMSEFSVLDIHGECAVASNQDQPGLDMLLVLARSQVLYGGSPSSPELLRSSFSL